MQYDNHSEKWVVRKSNDDGDTLTVINEKTGIGSRNLRRQGIRQSYDAFQKKTPVNTLQRESLRKALRSSQQILSTDALKNFEKSQIGRQDVIKEDEEAVELFSNRAVSLKKTLDYQSVAKSRSTTFTELCQLKKSRSGTAGVVIPSKQGDGSRMVS